MSENQVTVKAIYQNGVFRPTEPVDLEEHTEVEVLIPEPSSPDAEDPTGWKAAEALIGFIEDAPTDMAENHDQYLYDQRKA
jgi:predicted DNA-binding antitoxin AbrB/MazE fold protein